MSNALPKSESSSELFKRKAQWEGLRLEHCRHSGELPKHSHREHVVLLCLNDGAKGELVTASGSGLCGTQSRGTVAIIPAGLEHGATLDRPAEHLALYVDPSLIHRAASNSRLSDGFEIRETYTRHDRAITAIGMALLDELNTDGLSGRLYADSLANVLAVHLLRNYATGTLKPRHQGGLAAKKLRLVTEFIADNYAADLRLEDLAQVAGMSSFHFAREFKKTTGTTPHQYLIKFRIDRAKGLLETSDLSLVDVGLKSGFSHQSHFTRLFRKLTGTTPQLYRYHVQTTVLPEQPARTVNVQQ